MSQADQIGNPATDQNADLSPDLIIAPRWLIPVEPAATVLTDHVIAIKGGKILAIEERERALTNWPGAK